MKLNKGCTRPLVPPFLISELKSLACNLDTVDTPLLKLNFLWKSRHSNIDQFLHIDRTHRTTNDSH